MQACLMLANIVMIYEEKRENDWNLILRLCSQAQGI
jgi:hypothetical protein